MVIGIIVLFIMVRYNDYDLDLITAVGPAPSNQSISRGTILCWLQNRFIIVFIITVITVIIIIVIKIVIIMRKKKPCSMFPCSSPACFASNLDFSDPANHAPDFHDDHVDDDGADDDDHHHYNDDHVDVADNDVDGVDADHHDEEHADVRYNDNDRRALMGWGAPVET